jgi:hypothetical protein
MSTGMGVEREDLPAAGGQADLGRMDAVAFGLACRRRPTKRLTEGAGQIGLVR